MEAQMSEAEIAKFLADEYPEWQFSVRGDTADFENTNYECWYESHPLQFICERRYLKELIESWHAPMLKCSAENCWRFAVIRVYAEWGQFPNIEQVPKEELESAYDDYDDSEPSHYDAYIDATPLC